MIQLQRILCLFSTSFVLYDVGNMQCKRTMLTSSIAPVPKTPQVTGAVYQIEECSSYHIQIKL